jgi:hypothetical protein
MALMDVPHVTGAQTEMEMRQDGSVDIIVVVETDLELDVLHPKHDKVEVASLVQALSCHMISNPYHAGKLCLRTVGR